MQQKLLNAEFASGEYLNAGDKNKHVFPVIKALTKVLHNCFCCIMPAVNYTFGVMDL